MTAFETVTPTAFGFLGTRVVLGHTTAAPVTYPAVAASWIVGGIYPIKRLSR